MIKIRKAFVCAIIFLFSNSLAYAEGDNCSSGDTTEVYFVNGVYNTYVQADATKDLIVKEYKSIVESQYPDEKIEFKLAYNYSAGMVRDILEVMDQKMDEVEDEDENTFTPYQLLIHHMTSAAIPSKYMPVSLAIHEFMAINSREKVDAAEHIQKYRTDLQEGRRVLLIAHSQGNLFANQAVSALMSQYGNSIGMIGVASPAAKTYNDSVYYTAHDDYVIKALKVISEVLEPNIDNDLGADNDSRDFSNHEFDKSYFSKELPSREKIDNAFFSYLEKLESPISELGSGAITVTLTWGSEPDVDLHVTEPNGTHVFYSNSEGASGYLDLDDTDGFGPEHYYVSCETLEKGSYKVGVNYFSGEGPETARVQVSTADGNTRSFTKALFTAVGDVGDSSPLQLSVINVGIDDNGKYQFTVN